VTHRTTPLDAALFDTVAAQLSPPLAHHSMRTFVFAEMIAQRTGACELADYDRDLLLAATLLHDLGLGAKADGTQRFEVQGADLAATLLRGLGWSEGSIDRVWEAIALHTSGGIAERRSLLSRLTREGVLADLGRHPLISLDDAASVHEMYPREEATRTIVDAAVLHAARSPAAGAPYTLAGELLRERRESGRTRLEALARDEWR
jgi:hypothetical protein